MRVARLLGRALRAELSAAAPRHNELAASGRAQLQLRWLQASAPGGPEQASSSKPSETNAGDAPGGASTSGTPSADDRAAFMKSFQAGFDAARQHAKTSFEAAAAKAKEAAGAAGAGTGSSSSGADQQAGAGASSSGSADAGSAGDAGAGAGAGASGKRGSFLDTVVRELKAAIMPQHESESATRAYDGPVAAANPAASGPSDLVLQQQQDTKWQRVFNDMKDKFGHMPFFQRLSKVNLADSSVVKKGQELRESLAEKWETSDSPLVHKVEDVKERFFTQSDAAQTMQEIRARDPAFDLNKLIAGVKADAPIVVTAFLKHDLATLAAHCGTELMERFTGIFKHFKEAGLHEDPTILFIGDVELSEMRLVDGDPLLVVMFAVQQIKCTRDRFGNVVEGGPNDIQKVFYFWGLQQDKAGVATADGRYLAPRWVIKDMMWQSMLMLA